ncbi:MAG: phage morphogenesis protein [Pseudomonadota bacterium]
MARRSTLKWNGKAISDRMRRAQKIGVNNTMSDCVVHAKNNHAWQNRSGVLEGSIDVAQGAREVPGGVEGIWGSKGVAYALIHERGGVITPTQAQALAIPQPDGSVRFVKSVTIPARPYLRPAADAHYPELARNIRTAFEQLGQGAA